MVHGVVVFVKSSVANIVYVAIKLGKRLFMMPEGTCRFNPTCSQYTREALRVLPLYKAIPQIFHRLSRCHPKGDFGYDPVIDPNEEKST